MPTEYENWIGVATAAWLAPYLTTVAILECATLAMTSTLPHRDAKVEPFEVPCPDEELFA